jgi:hypothetical protein
MGISKSQSPLEAAQAKLIAVRSNLSQRGAELARLQEERDESLITDAPIHLADIERLALDVRHLEDVAAAWAEEVKRLRDEERERKRRYKPVCVGGIFWYPQHLETGERLRTGYNTFGQCLKAIDQMDGAEPEPEPPVKPYVGPKSIEDDYLPLPDGGADLEYAKWRGLPPDGGSR